MDNFKGPRVPILFLLYAGDCAPIRGAIRFQKMVFILKAEYKVSKRTFTSITFKAHRFGMYSSSIQDDLVLLMNFGLIETDRKDDYALDFVEREDEDLRQPIEYRLTEKGAEFVRRIIQEMEKSESDKAKAILAACDEVKSKFNNIDLKDLLRYVYQKYPAYIVKSEILDQIMGTGL